jgi:hypothetical protein
MHPPGCHPSGRTRTSRRGTRKSTETRSRGCPCRPSPWPVPDNGRLAAVCSYGVSGSQGLFRDVVQGSSATRSGSGPCRSARGRQPTKCPGSASWTTDRAQQPILACGFRCLDPLHHLAGRHRGPTAHMALEVRLGRAKQRPERGVPQWVLSGWFLPSANSAQSPAGRNRRSSGGLARGRGRGRHSTTWRARSPRGGGVKIRSWFPGEQRQQLTSPDKKCAHFG